MKLGVDVGLLFKNLEKKVCLLGILSGYLIRNFWIQI